MDQASTTRERNFAKRRMIIRVHTSNWSLLTKRIPGVSAVKQVPYDLKRPRRRDETQSRGKEQTTHPGIALL